MARRRASSGGSSGSSRHAQDPLPPHHHQWLAPLCGDAGRLRALADELGGMVEKEKAATAQAVTHVVGVEMEGEAAAGEQQQQQQQQQQHTAALARALAGRLGARYLPFNADSAVRAGAGAGAEEEEGGGVALLCCAWVHAGGRLEAAAQGLGRQGYRVAGVAALRFEANEHTAALAAAHKIYSKSWAHGACPLPLPPTATNGHHTRHRPPSSSSSSSSSSSPPLSAASDRPTQTSSAHEQPPPAVLPPSTYTAAAPPPPPPAVAAAASQKKEEEEGAGLATATAESTPPSSELLMAEGEEEEEEELAPMALTQEEEEEEEEGEAAAAAAAAAVSPLPSLVQAGMGGVEEALALPPPPPPPLLEAEDSNGTASTVADDHPQQQPPPPPPGPLPSRKRKAAAAAATTAAVGGGGGEWRRPVLGLQHSSAFEEANAPGEDRYCNRPPRLEPPPPSSSPSSLASASAPPPPPRSSSSTKACGLYAVLDGHGGPRAAEYGARVLIPLILRRLEEAEAPNPPPQQQPQPPDDAMDEDEQARVVAALKKAFVQADEDFLAQLDPNVTVEEARGYWNAGTCVVLALIRHRTLYVAHVGDCRAVLGRSAQPLPLPGDTDSPSTHTTHDASSHTFHSSSGSSSKRARADTTTPPTTAATRASPRRACASFSRHHGPPPTKVVPLVLTADHSCGNQKEVRLLRARCRDPNPIRLSIKDTGNNNGGNRQSSRAAAGAGGVSRVAGSLMVTRALGDAYLKRPSFSFPPYKAYVPYIVSEPEVTVHELDPRRDRFLVLATDGLWERLTNEEAVNAVERFHHYHQAESKGAATASSFNNNNNTTTTGPHTASEALVEEVLTRVASLHGMAPRTLKRLPRGGQRRGLHDDVCATVVRFDWGQQE